MKLIISRNQKKTMLSGIHFIVSFTLVLSAEEDELLKRYGRAHATLGSVADLWNGSTVPLFKIGVKFETDNVWNALKVEEEVISDCKRLKAYIETANAYGGTEEITI